MQDTGTLKASACHPDRQLANWADSCGVTTVGDRCSESPPGLSFGVSIYWVSHMMFPTLSFCISETGMSVPAPQDST